MTSCAAIVLAGGAATRLGGGLKPAVTVGGRRMLDRVLEAVGGARHTVVVGPANLDVPHDIARVQEDPPGGGPVCAIAAGMREDTDVIAIVAGDLPLLSGTAIEALTTAIGDGDGAIYVDGDDRPQWLCGVWRANSINRRLREVASERGTLDGASLRALFGPLRVSRIRHHGSTPPPYLDCDTEDDIRQAEEWLAR